jgi:hypothetical protein
MRRARAPVRCGGLMEEEKTRTSSLLFLLQRNRLHACSPRLAAATAVPAERSVE